MLTKAKIRSYDPLARLHAPGRPDDSMNAQNEMSHDEMVRTRLDGLRRQHRELDEAIMAMAVDGVVCSMTLGRMKRQKLALKDQIARLEDELTPDIIA